jgi:hypothetical protein
MEYATERKNSANKECNKPFGVYVPHLGNVTEMKGVSLPSSSAVLALAD